MSDPLSPVHDAVSRYRSATEASDIDALMATLDPRVTVISPISGRMVFRGAEDTRILLSAVYVSLPGFRWTRQLDGDRTSIVIGEGKVAGVTLGDAMVFDLGDDGRITRISPHLRPWFGLTTFALVLAPKLARHPGVLWRALTRK